MTARKGRGQDSGGGPRPHREPPPNVAQELDEAEALYRHGRLDEAITRTARLAAQHPGMAVVRAFHGALLAQRGRLPEAIANLEEALRLDPYLGDAPYNLAQAYLHESSIARAIQTARRYLQMHPRGEFVNEMRMILSGAEELMVETAAELGVSASTMERASLLNELAQDALGREDYRTAARLARDSARLVPRWTSPRNNQALALFMGGQIAEAIRVEEALLAEIDSDNLFAIGNLVRFYAALGDQARAEEYLRRLEELPTRSTADYEKKAEAFASLDRDQEVYDLLKLARRGPGRLSSAGLRLLVIAAANLGHREEALRLAEELAEDYGQVEELPREERAPEGAARPRRLPYFAAPKPKEAGRKGPGRS